MVNSLDAHLPPKSQRDLALPPHPLHSRSALHFSIRLLLPSKLLQRPRRNAMPLSHPMFPSLLDTKLRTLTSLLPSAVPPLLSHLPLSPSTILKSTLLLHQNLSVVNSANSHLLPVFTLLLYLLAQPLLPCLRLLSQQPM